MKDKKQTIEMKKDDVIKNFEILGKQITVYSFSPQEEFKKHLLDRQIPMENFHEESMSLEDAFIGLTGKY